jgi:hypothetical protein
MDASHSQPGENRLVKVRFSLPEDDDEGWPPVTSEGLWAEPLGGDRYRIDNTPWFARNLSAHDIVEALADDDGVLWATKKVRSSGRLTVRVIPLGAGPLGGDLQAVLDTFADLQVVGEGAAPAFHIVALDIPADADHREIVSRLRAGEENGSWEYEEGSVTDEWLAL